MLCKWCRAILYACLLAAEGFIPARAEQVVLVKSAQRAEYEKTARMIVSTFEESSMDLHVEEVQLGSDRGIENEFWNSMMDDRPELIITMGTPATRSALENVKGIPIIFTMVLDNYEERNSGPGNSNVSGVTLAIPVDRQLEIIKKVLPDTRRVGFLYSKSSEHMFRLAGETASDMGLRLIEARVESERDVPTTLRRILSEVDLLWMPPDAVIYEEKILHFILPECLRSGVPIMAVSKKIAEVGTPLAIGFDYEDIGRQTAELALKRLSRGSSSECVIEPPRKVVLYVNQRVASSLRLDIPEGTFEQVVSVQSGSS